jgi:membrane protein required for colicin V production
MDNIIQNNWADLIIIGIIAFTAIKGLFRGLIRSVFDIIALFIAIYLAFNFYMAIAKYLSGFIKIPGNLIYVISFILIWIGSFLAASLIGNLIHKLIGKGILGPANFIGGGIFGTIKGLMIVWLILQGINMLPIPYEAIKPIKQAQSLIALKPCLDQIPAMMNLIPKDFYNQINSSVSNIKKENK